MGTKINMMPEQCKVNQPVIMSIQIFGITADLTVAVSSSAFEVVGERWQRLGAQAIKFELVPRDQGSQIAEVEFFSGTSRVGYIIIETEVEEPQAIDLPLWQELADEEAPEVPAQSAAVPRSAWREP